MMLRRAFLKLTTSAAVAAVVAVESFRSPVHAFVPSTDLPQPRKIEKIISPFLQALRDWNDERSLAVAQGRAHEYWEGPQVAPQYVHTMHVGRKGFIPVPEDAFLPA